MVSIDRRVVWGAFLGLALAACGDDAPNPGDGAVIIDSYPAKVSKETHVSFAFHAEDASITKLFCSVDSAQPTECTSPLATDVVEGTHTFAVAVTTSSTPATYDWRVDTTPPETTITSGPPALDASTSPSFTFEGAPAGDAAKLECQLDTGAIAICTSPMTVTVTEGTHTFTVRATDEAGNVDPTPATRTWTVDTTAPSVTITSGPSGPTTLTQPMFAWTNSSDVTITECQVDAAAFAACTTPTTTTALAQGDHTFTVRVKDAAGNAATASRMFAVDTMAPSVTITGGPSGPTNSSMPTWTFTTSGSPTTTECRVDTGTFLACSAMYTTGLADGTHVFEVRVSDAAGNTANDTRTVMVDTVVPTVAITSGPQGPTAIVAPTFTFTALDSPTVIECRVDAAAFGACTTPGSYISPALIAGPHTFEVRVADAAGNSSTATRSFSIDIDGPTVMITSGPSGSTNNSTATFTFTTAGSPTMVQCRFDAAVLADCSSGMFSAMLSDGPHTFEVDVADPAGNTGSATQGFTIDTMAPTVTITGGPTGTTSNTTPMFTFVTSGATTTTCQIDSGAAVACSMSFTTTPLGGGPHTFTVNVADAAGNTATASRSFDVDSVAPSVTITGAPASSTNLTTAAFTFTYGANAATVQCSYDGAAPVDCIGAAGAGTFSAPAGAEGSHSFTVTACNVASVCASDSRMFTVDRTAPVIVLDAPPDPNNLAVITFNFVINGNPATVTCKIDNAVTLLCPGNAFTTPTLDDQQHTFVISAIDAAGNVATKTFTWTTDTLPPTVMLVSGPTGATNLAPQPVDFVFTTGGMPITTQCAFDGAPFVDCSSGRFNIPAPAGPNALSQGIHTFRVKVTDLATNAFTFNQGFIVDTVAEAVAVSGAALTSDSTPDFTFAATTTTTAGPVTFECHVVGTGAFSPCTSPYTPSPLLDGSYVVEVRAIDGAGNISTGAQIGSFSFQVDTQAPNIAFTTFATPTVNPRPIQSFTATDASTVSLSCGVDLPPATAATSPCASTTMIQAIADLEAAGSEGSHSYTITAIDSAQPSPHSTTVQITFFVDRKPPVVAIDSPGHSTLATSPAISFTGSDASGPITTTCTIDSVNVPCSPSPMSFLPSTPFGMGTDHVLVVTAIDAADAQSPLTPNTTTVSWDIHVQTSAVAVNTGLPSPLPKPCFNGLEGRAPGIVALCTEDAGIYRTSTTGVVSWVTSPGTGGTALANLHGRAIAGGFQTMNLTYASDNSTARTATIVTASHTMGSPVTFTTALPHGFGNNSPIEVTGVADPAYNGTWIVALGGTLVSSTSFTAIRAAIAPPPFGAKETGNVATYTTTRPYDPNVIKPMATIQIAGVGVAGYNGTFTVDTTPTPNTFTVLLPVTGLATSGGAANANAPQVGVVAAADPTAGSLPMTASSGGTAQTFFNLYKTSNALDQYTVQASMLAVTNAAPPPPLAELYAIRPGGSTQNYAAGYAAGLGAVVFHGNSQTPTLETPNPKLDVVGVNGTVRAFAGPFPQPSISASDFYVAVNGALPGAPLSDTGSGGAGGVYYSCDMTTPTSPTSTNAPLGGTFAPRMVNIAPEDRPRVFSVTVDPSSVFLPWPTSSSDNPPCPGLALWARTYFVSVRGGNQIYKTADGGATWAASNTGLPGNAEVYTVTPDCSESYNNTPSFPTICPGPSALYAGTSAGVYKSTDGGAHWALEGLENEVVRSIAIPNNRTQIALITNVTQTDAANPFEATVTTSAAHGLAVGQPVVLADVGKVVASSTLNPRGGRVDGYIGTWTVTSVPDATTFKVLVKQSGLATVPGGTACPATQKCGAVFTPARVFAATEADGVFELTKRAPAIATFTATPMNVPPGVPTSVTFDWTYTFPAAPTCSIDNGVGPIKSGDSRTLTVATNTTYTLTCTNPEGTGVSTVTVSSP